MNKLSAIALGCLLAAGVGCDVDVKDEGELPDVQVEGGRAPDVDVTPPDVDVKTRETEVTVPDVDIQSKKTTVPVPDIDVDAPSENANQNGQ